MSDIDLLNRFGLVAEEDLAKLLGITVPTLKNKPRQELPDYVKIGRRRMFKEDSIREFLASKTVTSGR